MENRLKRKLNDGALTLCLGVNQARTPNITMIAADRELQTEIVVQHLPRGARADVERMRTLPVPRV